MKPKRTPLKNTQLWSPAVWRRRKQRSLKSRRDGHQAEESVTLLEHKVIWGEISRRRVIRKMCSIIYSWCRNRFSIQPILIPNRWASQRLLVCLWCYLWFWCCVINMPEAIILLIGITVVLFFVFPSTFEPEYASRLLVLICPWPRYHS